MKSIIYESQGIKIYGDEIGGIKFLQYGDPSWPAIIYLHGIGEVGKTPSALLTQSPICRGWNFATGQAEGFKFPDFFNKNIQVIAPILPSGSWTTTFINNFLTLLNLQTPKGLMGWSWGGGGVAGYLDQLTKLHKFEFGVLLSLGNYNSPGDNVTVPIQMVHGISDSTTSINGSDTYWSGIPSQFKIKFDRVATSDHAIWQKFLEPNTGIYEWMNGLFVSTQPPIITYEAGTVEQGSDGNIYFNLSGIRTSLK